MILFRFNVILPRDIICYLRLIVDSLPISIRNSRFLFNLSKILFKIPEELYNFREKYKNGLIKDLSIYYLKDNENSLKRVSKTTDINSYHLSLIENLLQNSKSVNVLDLGCGSGFLINRIDKIFSSSKLVGIDFNAPSKESIKSNSRNNQIQFICGDIKSSFPPAPFNNANYPFNNQFYLLLNVASGGNFDSNQLDPTKFCNNEQCTNLSEPDKGRFLIDYIEIKSID